jgi:hypothetical protein
LKDRTNWQVGLAFASLDLMLNPLGIFQLVMVALEGVAYAVNPKLREQDKKNAVGFGLVYVVFLVGGMVMIVLVVRSLYFHD